MLLDDGDLFVEGLEGGLRSKINLPRLEGLDLLEVSIKTLAKTDCLRVGLNLLLAEAGEGPVTGLDTLLHGRQVLVGLVLLLFERVNADVVGFNLLG